MAEDQDAVPFRVLRLEGRMDEIARSVGDMRMSHAGHSEALGAQAVSIARHEEQLNATREDIGEVKTELHGVSVTLTVLAEKFAKVGNRVAWALVGFAFTVAAGAITALFALPHGTP